MQKIVVDTNVLVSALIQKSYPYFIINEIFIEKKVEFCVSNKLFEEYYEVLNRKKFTNYHHFIAKAETLLADIKAQAKMFDPKTKIKIIRDLDDNKLLELAAACKADFLITGNTNDFTMTKYRRTRIVTPMEYWENYRPY